MTFVKAGQLLQCDCNPKPAVSGFVTWNGASGAIATLDRHASRGRFRVARPMERRMKHFTIAFLMLLAAASSAPAQEKTVTVFAAASLKNALDDINALYSQRSGTKVTVSYAASS